MKKSKYHQNQGRLAPHATHHCMECDSNCIGFTPCDGRVSEI